MKAEQSKADKLPRSHSSIERFIRWFAPLLILLAALVGIVLLGTLLKGDEEEPVTIQSPPVNVRTMVVTAETVEDTFEIKGTVKPRRVVRIAAEVGGRIESIASVTASGKAKNINDEIKKGAVVKVGTAIMFLNTDMFQAAYDQMQAQLGQAQYDLDVLERIQDEAGVVSEKELANAKSQLKIAEAQSRSAKVNLDRTTIVSPIGGTLNRLMKETGEYVIPGEVVAEIVDDSQYKAVFAIPERDALYFEKGDEHTICACSRGELDLVGTISYLSASADESTKTTEMELTLDKKVGDFIHSGLIVTARLKRRDLESVIMIPLQAVIPTESGHLVYIAEDGKARKREIEIDMRFIKGSSVRVLSGLDQNDRLIISGQRYCGNGQDVREEHVDLADIELLAYDLHGSVSAEELKEAAAELQVRFQRLGGVLAADVMVRGDREVPLLLSPEKLKAYE
ncbi:MAG TPA: efflux RND transporter periplasmic adaptor subunit, partial [Phycisphaerae bacterium]|nr:efflux RND transporter periplasmic adaptor subunit [Phycisphaerae bacterium]